MGSTHSPGGLGGAGGARPDEQLLRELRDDQRARDRGPAGGRGAPPRSLSGWADWVGKRGAPIGLFLALLAAACTFPPLQTPTPTPSPSPTPTPTGTPEPTPSPTPSPTPAAVVPDFAAGDLVA